MLGGRPLHGVLVLAQLGFAGCPEIPLQLVGAAACWAICCTPSAQLANTCLLTAALLPPSACSPADLLPHVEAANAFIAGARACGGAVLVHCYAGQSRSAALVIAYLMQAQGLGLMEAWALTRAARPCAQPNSGFLRQLALYGKRLAAGGGGGACASGAPTAVEPADSAVELALTQ